jgi:ribosomal protein S17E
MRIKWMILIAVAVLVMPASASATVSPTDYKNAAKFCKALRADMGAEAFKQAYGTNKNKSNAYGKCVSKSARTVDAIHSDAVKACKAEREADRAAFAVKYGTNKNGTNALGKCISKQAHDATVAKQDAIVNAAKSCKAERTADPAAFRDKYGTNKNKRNAFGKCVSKTVKKNETTTLP